MYSGFIPAMEITRLGSRTNKIITRGILKQTPNISRAVVWTNNRQPARKRGLSGETNISVISERSGVGWISDMFRFMGDPIGFG
jgi:hypothetical protein